MQAVSLRAVTRAAGVSVSAANYHFGSKEALVHAAMWRALAPLNRRRLERLEALEAAGAAGRAPSVEALVEAFLRPAFDLASREGASAYRQLAARLHGGSPNFEERVKRELLNPAFQRFVDALARALPDRRRDDLALAFQLGLGAALHVLGGHAQRLADVPALSDDALLDRLVRFAADGIRAACAVAAAEGAA